MNLCEKVFELAESFMKESKYVNINYDSIFNMCDKMENVIPPSFPPREGSDNVLNTCLKELIGDSINYCYWYGKDTIRPLDCSSGKMYSIIDDVFESYDMVKHHNTKLFSELIEDLCASYIVERFPLIEERVKHLYELKEYAEEFIINIFDVNNTIYTMENHLKTLISLFPGYGSDLFLKRAFLFFSQLNRIYGMFEEEMKNIPVPADYQVPKMLEYYDLINYRPELKFKITNQQLIPKGSLEECEIRAATIIACREIGKQLNWAMPQVDGFFWLKRKEVATPFHLCITTDY